LKSASNFVFQVFREFHTEPVPKIALSSG